jgi:hypothetical protein
MIRRFLVWSLLLLLTTSAEARERTPLEQAIRIPVGSEVTVTLRDKQAYTGRLGELSEDSLTLRPFVPGQADRLVLFQDVKKIAQRKEPSAVQKVGEGVLLVISLPILLLYCGIFNHECLGSGL